ncbi:MAG TPA: MogA/MoaB family molybdenum cofactor biosynthesis protein [Bryobacteraceae bacterium]|nr:MogA/MoaB family molybdenum cofactor biosynthesis protein [Bryobacteraceae bacterium]
MIRFAVITISDSAVAGTRADLSGPALEQRVQELGWTVAAKQLLRDEVMEIAQALMKLADGGEIDVILTTGGTGLGPRDVTPEATRAAAHREVPGFGEMMRAEGLKTTRFAPLSRGGAATRGQTLILNLPGSPRGAVDSFNVVAGLLPHAVDLLHGRTKH